MKKYLLFLFLFSIVVNMSGWDKPWKNGKLVVSENHRFLMFENGTPFFWQGETAWLMPERLNRDEAAYYLQTCRDAGYNMVQVQVMNGVPSFNIYGQMSLIDGFNFDAINQKGVYGYWDHLDYMIDQAAENGIYVGMVCIWGGLVKSGKINEEQAKAYGRFLAERYKDKPNIIWIMGGDIQGNIHTEVWDALANTIKSIDKNHLMTYHPRGRYTSAKWFNDRNWLDFNMFQSGHRRYGQRMGNKDYSIPDNTEEDNWQYVDSTWKYKPIKPVLDDEPIYEDIPQGLHDVKEPHWQAKDVRRYAYWSVFAGSCGHTYGHNAIMQFYRPGYLAAYDKEDNMKTWFQALQSPGYNQMKYLKNLMLTFPYFDRVPDQSIILENGVKYDRLIATRGNDYMLVYNYAGQTMKLDLRKISGKKKNVWTYNTKNGDFTYLGEFDNKIQTFHISSQYPDGSADFVLIAVDNTKNYMTKDQKVITGQLSTGNARDLNE
jgi:hypothetical protein